MLALIQEKHPALVLYFKTLGSMSNFSETQNHLDFLKQGKRS